MTDKTKVGNGRGKSKEKCKNYQENCIQNGKDKEQTKGH